jgi:hypothetical protein
LYHKKDPCSVFPGKETLLLCGVKENLIFIKGKEASSIVIENETVQ